MDSALTQEAALLLHHMGHGVLRLHCMERLAMLTTHMPTYLLAADAR